MYISNNAIYKVSLILTIMINTETPTNYWYSYLSM